MLRHFYKVVDDDDDESISIKSSFRKMQISNVNYAGIIQLTLFMYFVLSLAN